MKLKFENGRYICECTFHEKDTPKAVGFRWDPKNRYWWTSTTSIARKLASIADDSAARAFSAVDEQINNSKKVMAEINIPCPKNLEYLPFQKAGIEYALQRDNVLIADEMGLGKTVEAIGVINTISEIKKVLVICPASLKINWKAELKKWLVNDYIVSICDSKNGFPKTDIVVVNYDILQKYEKEIREIQWDLLILDEVHYTKSYRTIRAKQVWGNKDISPIPAKKRIALTGTPILNRPIEMWTMLNGMKIFTSWYQYVTRYCAGYNSKYGWDVSGASNLEELQHELRSKIMIRRLKNEVLKELPPKRRQIIAIPSNGCSAQIQKESKTQAEFDKKLAMLRARVELAKAESDETYENAVESLKCASQESFTEMAKIRHETALEKTPYAIEYIKDTLENINKVVVFAHHHDVIEKLRTGLIDYNPVIYTGETTMKDRDKAITEFQNNSNCRVFIGSITAAGVGITLTAASTVVFVELDWVPGNICQAEDRCHRIGQNDSVLIQHIVLDGSIDQKLAQTLVDKQIIIDKALDKESEIEPIEIITDESVTTKSVSKNGIAELAKKLTDEDIKIIHKKLQILADLDYDRAVEKNDMGFNRVDSHIGHDLAERISLTPKQAALASLILKKYHRQIN